MHAVTALYFAACSSSPQLNYGNLRVLYHLLAVPHTRQILFKPPCGDVHVRARMSGVQDPCPLRACVFGQRFSGSLTVKSRT